MKQKSIIGISLTISVLVISTLACIFITNSAPQLVIQPTPTEPILDLGSLILDRACIWLVENVRYGLEDHYKDTFYLTNCSGYVSFAWNLPKTVNTNEFVSSGYATVLNDISELQPGDILNNNRKGIDGHVVIFVKWDQKANGKFIAYEENVDPNGDKDYSDGRAVQSILTLGNLNGGGYTIEEFEKYTIAKGPYQAQRLIPEKAKPFSFTGSCQKFALLTPDVLGSYTNRDMPPSEGWIAFLNQNNLWLIHPDGTGLTQITSNSGKTPQIISFKWSPDGNKMAYSLDSSNGASIYLYDVSNSKTTTLITDTGGGFDWSPAGKQIIYDTPIVGNHDNDGLWIVDTETGSKRQVVKKTGDFPKMASPQWSSEGSHAIFSQWGMETQEFGIVNLDTGTPTGILPASFSKVDCKWAPSELRIACLLEVPNSTAHYLEAPYEVAFLDQNGNLLQEIPLEKSENANYWEAWSPDGKKLAIGYIPDGKSQTKLLSLDTGKFEDLVAGAPLDWSPDGRWIITWDVESSWSTPRQLSIVGVSSGTSRLLSEGTLALWQPAMEPPTASIVPGQYSVPTLTPVVSSVSTNTPSADQLPNIDVSITVNDTSQGNYLQIRFDGKQYEIGPLEKGAYAIGPNKKFFVYCSNSGVVYAARFGEPNLTPIGDVKNFSIIVRGEAPQLEFEFLGNHPYQVQIRELLQKQDKTLPIPRYITAPN